MNMSQHHDDLFERDSFFGEGTIFSLEAENVNPLSL